MQGHLVPQEQDPSNGINCVIHVTLTLPPNLAASEPLGLTSVHVISDGGLDMDHLRQVGMDAGGGAQLVETDVVS